MKAQKVKVVTCLICQSRTVLDDKYLNKYVRGKVCAAGTNKWRDLGIILMGQDDVPSLRRCDKYRPY